MDSLSSFNRPIIISGKSVTRIGNIELSHKKDIAADTFSASFINRMNNQSISLHKFGKKEFMVEFGSYFGVVHVLSMSDIASATEMAVLNTDITRIDDDVAIKARRVFVSNISALSGLSRKIAIPEKSWLLNKYRNTRVVFETDAGKTRHGILNVLLPVLGKKEVSCMITPDDDQSKKIVVESSKIWIK